MIQYVIEGFGVEHDKDNKIYVRALINLPIAILILLPLSLKRDMSSLAFAGVMSIASLTYTLLVLLVETPFYFQEFKAYP